MKNKKIFALALAMGILIQPVVFASEINTNPDNETEPGVVYEIGEPGLTNKSPLPKEWEGKTFEEVRDAEIQRAKNSDGIINEAKKDLIVMLYRTSSKEDLAYALAQFNPQGPVEDYPTLKSKHKLTALKDGGYSANIRGKDYILDDFGNFKGGFSSEKSAKSFDSQYNSLIAKFITNYELLPLEEQADYEIIIQNMMNANPNEFPEVLEMHKEINNKFIEYSKSEEMTKSLVESNEALDRYIKGDYSKYTQGNDATTPDKKEDNKPVVEKEIKEEDKSDTEKTKEENKSTEEHKDVYQKEENNTQQKTQDEEQRKENNTQQETPAKSNVKTGVESIWIIAVVLVLAIVLYIIFNKKSKKE